MRPDSSNPQDHNVNKRGVLDWIEWAGNKLPDPSILFMLLALTIIILSAVGSAAGWSVQPVKPQVVMETQLDGQGKPVTDAAGLVVQVPKKDANGQIQVELVKSGAPFGSEELADVRRHLLDVFIHVEKFCAHARPTAYFCGDVGYWTSRKIWTF